MSTNSLGRKSSLSKKRPQEMKKRCFDKIVGSIEQDCQDAQNNSLRKKQRVKESLLERLWLLPDVGERFLEPCFSTNEHVKISRSCKSLADIVSNARTCIFSFENGFNDFLKYAGHTEIFSKLRTIILRSINLKKSANIQPWILSALRFPKLQEVEINCCSGFEIVVEEDVKLQSLYDASDALYCEQNRSTPITIKSPQYLVSYTGTGRQGTRDLLQRVPSLRNLTMSNWALNLNHQSGSIPTQTYETLENLSLSLLGSFGFLEEELSSSTFTLPYPATSVYCLKSLELKGIDSISLPSGPQVFDNLTTLKINEVTKLTAFNELSSDVTKLYFPNLVELEISITYQGFVETLKQFCNSETFLKLEHLKLYLRLVSNDDEEEEEYKVEQEEEQQQQQQQEEDLKEDKKCSIIVDLKQYFPYLQSTVIEFFNREEMKVATSVIVGDTLQNLCLNFHGKLPSNILLSSSSSLQNVHFEARCHSLDFYCSSDCIEFLTTCQIDLYNLSHPKLNLSFCPTFVTLLKFVASGCSTNFSEITLQEIIGKTWQNTQQQIFHAMGWLLHYTRQQLKQFQTLFDVSLKGIARALEQIKVVLLQSYEGFERCIQTMDKLLPGIENLQKRYFDAKQILDQLRETPFPKHPIIDEFWSHEFKSLAFIHWPKFPVEDCKAQRKLLQLALTEIDEFRSKLDTALHDSHPFLVYINLCILDAMGQKLTLIQNSTNVAALDIVQDFLLLHERFEKHRSDKDFTLAECNLKSFKLEIMYPNIFQIMTNNIPKPQSIDNSLEEYQRTSASVATFCSMVQEYQNIRDLLHQ